MTIQKNVVSTEPKIPSGGLALLIRVKQAVLEDALDAVGNDDLTLKCGGLMAAAQSLQFL